MASTSTFPPVVAVFLTHFDDTKGQSVLYYKSHDETKLPSGTIEHSSLPSGLHLMEEDTFMFRHGPYPAVGMFRSRSTAVDGSASGSKGRGRRMATLGVVLADRDTTDEVFGPRVKEALGGLYERIEALGPSPFSAEGRIALNKALDEVWETYKSEPMPGNDGEQERRYRKTVEGGGSLSDDHPLGHLPELVRVLGPQIVTVYKAALSGQRILLYSQPPLSRLAAFAYCISAMSLPPRHLSHDDGSAEVGVGVGEWIGQVGLMDLDDLSKRQGPWVATTSDKILLSHPRLYGLSIDLSSPVPDLQASQPGLQPNHRAISYSFGDVPLYKALQTLSTPTPPNFTPDPNGPGTSASVSAGDDWWITLYDLMDRVWSLCTGVCEYAIGKGRVGEISLRHDQDGEGEGEGGEDARLLDDEQVNEADGAGTGLEVDNKVHRGRMIMRQLYHNTHHLHQRLQSLNFDERGGGGMTKAEARRLTGQWIVSEDDIRFWTDLGRRWGMSTTT